MAKILYKPVAILVGALAGLIASKIFEKLWEAVSDQEPAEPHDRDAGWGEVLVAAALQGAIFAGVRAVVDRAGAKGFEQTTGIWPGNDSDERA